jgi:hypothetical protein
MAEVMKENDEHLKDEELVIVEDESKLSQNQNAEDDDDEHDDDDHDAAVAKNEDEEDADDDDEREAIRERRRLEKQERKQRRDEAIKRDKLELDFLRKRNDDLERRVSVQEQRTHKLDLSAFDAEIAKAANEAEMADRVIAKAVAAGNGEDVTQAMRYRDQALARIQQLNFQKNQVAAQRPQPQQIDDMTMNYAREFIAENPWYDSQGRDEDSAIVIAIDQSLAKDGYDPRSSDYWDELRRRAARRLPERFNQKAPAKRKADNADDRAEARREPRGGPAVGSGREHAPTSTRKEIYISPERKQALIDAGVWDDPVLRSKYVKRYAEYDRQNRS